MRRDGGDRRSGRHSSRLRCFDWTLGVDCSDSAVRDYGFLSDFRRITRVGYLRGNREEVARGGRLFRRDGDSVSSLVPRRFHESSRLAGGHGHMKPEPNQSPQTSRSVGPRV